MNTIVCAEIKTDLMHVIGKFNNAKSVKIMTETF